MTFDHARSAPTSEIDTDALAELLFYHNYVDHYAIAEHYVARDLGAEDLEEFGLHLEGCQECADRVLLAEMFRDPSPKRRGTVQQAIAESVREIVEEAHASSGVEPTGHGTAKPAKRPARTPVLAALAHSKKLGAVPPPLPKQMRPELHPEPIPDPLPQAILDALPEAIAQPAARVPEIVTIQTPKARSARYVIPKPLPPLDASAFLCTYEADRRGCHIPSGPGSCVAACPLPQRARWIASFSPLQLMLIGGAAALVLMAIPCGLFILELARLARK